MALEQGDRRRAPSRPCGPLSAESCQAKAKPGSGKAVQSTTRMRSLLVGEGGGNGGGVDLDGGDALAVKVRAGGGNASDDGGADVEVVGIPDPTTPKQQQQP